MHDLISRTYDLASSQISKHDLMSEVADVFSARAAALVLSVAENPPELIGFGANQTATEGDDFAQSLQASLSEADLERLVASNFSTTMGARDGRRYTLLLNISATSMDAGDTDSARALLSHIVRSIHVAEWSDQSIRGSAQVMDEFREELNPATIVLDETSRVVDMNNKASFLLESSAIINEVHGRLEVSEPSMAAQLRKCLRTLLDEAGAEPVFLRLDEQEGAKSLTLLLKRRETPTRGVVIYVSRVRTDALDMPARIIQKFGLSPKEARLTGGLLQGKSLGDLANEYSVSTHTLRAQMKSIFKKTNVISQAALILLVLDDHFLVFDQ